MATASSLYFPALSNIFSTDSIPETFSFIKDEAEDLLDNIYYKDIQKSLSDNKSEGFYSLSIIARKRLSFEIFGTGIFFVLNPDYSDATISAFPITLYYDWQILSIINKFNQQNYSFGSKDIFEILVQYFKFRETIKSKTVKRKLY